MADDGAQRSRLVVFALSATAVWLGVCAVLGASHWQRWRAPLDSALVYGPTLEERTAALLGAYAPVVTSLKESVPIDAFVIVVLPQQPLDQAALFTTHLAAQLAQFVRPRTLVPADPEGWRERLAEFDAGAPVFVLDLLNLVAPADDLLEVTRSDVHVLWRLVRHG